MRRMLLYLGVAAVRVQPLLAQKTRARQAYGFCASRRSPNRNFRRGGCGCANSRFHVKGSLIVLGGPQRGL